MDNNNLITKTFGDVQAARELVWLGIDFSNVRLVGPSGFQDIHSIVNIYFAAINELFMREPRKFNFQKFIRKSVRYSLEKAFERNMSIKTEGLVVVSDVADRMHEGVVQQIASEYGSLGENGIGLLFIAEALDKNRACSIAWVTFIDMQTARVIRTVKVPGNAGGFGFRNYWANSFHNILKLLAGAMK